jgi:SET domain-containing protein
MLHLPFLYVAPSELGGKGVFTGQTIEKGSVIELAPVIVLSAQDREAIHQTRLHDYYFQWDGDRAAIALGLGSLYNHDESPNADFILDYEFKQIRFTSIRKIKAGEEIRTNYRVGDQDMRLWFEAE